MTSHVFTIKSPALPTLHGRAVSQLYNINSYK